MKQLTYIFILLIIMSCKNDAMKSMDMEANEIDISEYKESAIEESERIEIIGNNSFSYKDISTEKLQELYDLLALKEKHPEFNEKIESQLKNYTDESFKTLGDVLIKNVTLKGEVISLSDSVQKLKIYYDVVSSNKSQQDSIWAEITTQNIHIDGKAVKSKKIKFKKN
ncbi:hypothetical protein [uncultured Lacinutrix sp.]|uniref:hypothetical protein n=1 Tax=uncultured Lacinutrix sp. TaxID=574032 RepID=UPI002621F781|nr:hypothetical protein [uncultured Lacinutrix sp.]